MSPPRTSMLIRNRRSWRRSTECIKQRGLTTLLVTHDPHWVEQYSNKVYLLKDGKSHLIRQKSMSWIDSLSYPFMQHALVAVLFAGIAFPLIGVFITSLNLIPLRFAMMHIASARRRHRSLCSCRPDAHGPSSLRLLRAGARADL